MQPESTPESTNVASHDAITRLLHRIDPSSEPLWQEAQPQVQLNQGILGVDDSTLDKWSTKKMEWVTRHWSGQHGRVVQGINLMTLLWTEMDYWATHDLNLGELQRLQFAEVGWAIEEYHRGLKQCCGAERAQVRSSRAQRNHVALAIRAFLRLELHWFTTGISGYEAKLAIVRDAIRAYLAAPCFVLITTA